MRSMIAFLIVLFAAFPALGGSAPFGVEVGTPIAELPVTSHQSLGTYSLKSVPNPHPEFGFYEVQASKASGVCRVRGWTGGLRWSPEDGGQVKPVLDALRRQVTAKYGPPGTGKHRVAWHRDSGSDLPADIETISLEIHDVSPEKWIMTITYQFSTWPRCKAEIAADEGAAF